MNRVDQPRPPFAMGKREFVTMMAMLQALQALAIDAMLPALGVMAQELNAATDNDRQLVVGVFLLGIGAGSLVPGTLADRFGRRPLVLVTLAFYVIPMVACAFVQDFDTLLGLRLVQALGCSGLAVLPAAIIRDRFDGDQMARQQSLVSVVFMTVPMLAPALGQGIMALLGWRWIFGAMGVLGVMMAVWVWVRLPETLDPQGRHAIRIEAIAVSMAKVVTTRESIGYVLASTLMMSAIWGYLNSSQQLLAEGFGAGDAFPYVFGAIIGGMIVANLINARIVNRFGARRVSQTGIFAFIAVALVQVYFACQPNQTLWQFSAIMCVNMGLVGFMGANFISIALQPFGKSSGIAASVQAFLRLVIGSLIGAAIGQAYDGTARPLAFSLLACGCMALVLVLFSERGRLFRRVNPARAARPPDIAA